MSARGDALAIAGTERAMALVSAKLGLGGDASAAGMKAELLALEPDELVVALACSVGFAAALVCLLEEHTDVPRERWMSTAAATYLYRLEGLRDR